VLHGLAALALKAHRAVLTIWKVLARRLPAGLLIVWGVYTLTFFAVNLAPGDPFTAKENPKVQEEDLARLRAEWGYDRPVFERYALHMRKMVWEDEEILVSERGGLAFEVFADGGKNFLRAHVQTPPDALRLVPTKRSAQEDGALPVELRRLPEGSWSTAGIKQGRYQIGLQFLTVGDAPVALDTQGLTLNVEGGTVTARQSRAEPPEEIRLTRAAGGEVVLPRGTSSGAYGPVPVEADAYTFSDAHTSSPLGLSVPEKPLSEGGLTFDLGTSILNREKVVKHLRHPLKNTLILTGCALVVQFVVGVFLGVISAVRRGSLVDRGLTPMSLFLYSMPGFWLAVMLQLLFAIKLDWFPLSGMYDVGSDSVWNLLHHLVLPTAVLGLAGAAGLARYQRSSMLEVMNQDYVRTARAKGLTERAVIWRHALRNALLPTITLLGLSLPFLVSGAVITEQIFSWPGMGREAITAISGRDVTVVTGITLIATVMVVVGSLLADVLYALVDPRVRFR
jgi:peptide/nickel transport system permease protein